MKECDESNMEKQGQSVSYFCSVLISDTWKTKKKKVMKFRPRFRAVNPATSFQTRYRAYSFGALCLGRLSPGFGNLQTSVLLVQSFKDGSFRRPSKLSAL